MAVETKTRGQRRLITRKTHEAVAGYLFIAPAVLIIGVFTLGALVFALYISFTDYNGVETPDFVGLSNYARVFKSQQARGAFFNTLQFAIINVPGILCLSLISAVLLNRRFRGMRVVRSAYFIPIVSSAVVAAAVFKAMLQYKGPVNALLSLVGLGPYAWLTDAVGAFPRYSVIIMSLWRGTAYWSVILLAALQDIPQDLLDAAEVDGANAWQRLLNVTLPQLRPVLAFVLIMNTIGQIRLFAEPLLLVGGNMRSTRTIALYIYNQMKSPYGQASAYGYGSALSFVLLSIMMVITLIQLRVTRERT